MTTPYAWAVETEHQSKTVHCTVVQQEIFPNEPDARRWQKQHGGVVFPLYTRRDDDEVRLLRRACDAAFAFIDSHVADPDLTVEMVRTYSEYKAARAALESQK